LPQHFKIIFYILQFQEVAWTYVVTLIQSRDIFNLFIQSCETVHDIVNRNPGLVQLLQHTQTVLRFDFNEPKPPSHRKIETFYTSVNVIHCADNINILRDIEPLREWVFRG